MQVPFAFSTRPPGEPAHLQNFGSVLIALEGFNGTR